MWRENDVRAYGEGTKSLRHPVAGLIALEYSAFAVDGRRTLAELQKTIKNINQHPNSLIFGR